MGNLLQYADKSKTIDARLNTILSAVKRAYKEGSIRTEAEYYYRTKEAVSELYNSLTKPSFVFRPAVSTPMSDEYNSMVEEACDDMAYIIGDCEALEEFVSRSFSDADLSRDMMNKTLNSLSRKVDSIMSDASSGNSDGYATFTELFTDMSNMLNGSDPNCLCLDSANSMLRLRAWEFSEVLPSNIEIDPDESNGLPGNTHVASSLNDDLYFDGQDSPHMKIKNICDRNYDTWFEYEIFNIDDATRMACGSYGFEYSEGIKWITDDSVLRLKLILSINSSLDCSWIILRPFLPEVKGVKACYIEKCDIICTNGTTYRVAENKAFEDMLCCPFPAHPIQRVEITFIQPSKYLTKVGHFYYASANTETMPLFEAQGNVEAYARVDGPKPSVGYLECIYDPTTQWVKYVDMKNCKDSLKSSKEVLFVPGETTLDKKSGQELINAYRHVIGIREITVHSCSFTTYGEYISVPYKTDEDITSISIESDEYIPGSDSECIQYFISLNKGLTWHKIYPVHRAYCGIYRYYVNNDTISNLINNKPEKRSQNLSVMGKPDTIQVKIEMYRPSEGIHMSPIVNSYRLRLTVGGDTVEY